MSGDNLLKRGIAAFKSGQNTEARMLFEQALKQDQRNEKAWLWMSCVVETDEDRRACLEKVLAINPSNTAAIRGLEYVGAGERKAVSAENELEQPATQQLHREPPGQTAITSKKSTQQQIDWWVIAGLGLLAVLVAAVVLLAFPRGGDQQAAAAAVDAEGEVTAVIYENLAAHNAEDIERYMATVHSKFPGRAETRDTLERMYATYDLKATVKGVEVIAMSKNEAKVSFVLITKKVRGPAFRDNRITGTFILRKEGDEWKLVNQGIDTIEYLN
jgi:ketosteroid isomerase-like protein